jgi:aryl-alcohol dehydrogenase-like predicted oxidoreductase
MTTLDVLYLHNVVETQGAILPPEEFEKRLKSAFEFLEKARIDNKIKYYGLATWNCFRTPQSNRGLHSNLQDIINIAENVGGKSHGLRFIQTPINIMHPEAFVENYQSFKDTKTNSVTNATLTAVCSALQVNLISSSPLLQGHMVNLPLENSLFNVKNNSAKHLQLIRSIPAESLKCTVVGMKNQVNIKSNLEVIGKPPLTSKQFYEVLAPKKRTPFIETNL